MDTVVSDFSGFNPALTCKSCSPCGQTVYDILYKTYKKDKYTLYIKSNFG